MPVPAQSVIAQRQPSTPTISVIIPALNEAKNIGWVLQRIPSYVDEVIIVDGLSDDGTLEVAKRIAPDVIAVREMRRGKGAAMRAGFAAARGDYLVVLDADGSMDPAEIGRYVEALDAGFELVKGSRYLEGGGSTDLTAFRSFGNSGLRAVANVLFNTKFSELCYGFFALRRDCLPRLALDADGFEIETQTVVHAVIAGLRITEVPSSETPRLHGESNLHPIRDGLRIMRVLLRVRTRGIAAHADAVTAQAAATPAGSAAVGERSSSAS